MQKRFLNVEEPAEYLGVKKATIYSWTHMRAIPYVKVGRLVKFDLHKINEWIEERSMPMHSVYRD